MRILSNIIAFAVFFAFVAMLVLFMFPKAGPNPAPIVHFDSQEEGEKESSLPTMLHPLVEKCKGDLITRAEQKGIDVVITEGHRTKKRQNELYEQGRSTDGKIVTHAKAGESYHNYGLAIDYALRTSDGKIIWNTKWDGNNNGKSDWLEVAAIAKDIGFEWGGDWVSFKDYPHLQMDFGLSIRELKRGERPKIDEYANK